jgi:hypothetical protein
MMCYNLNFTRVRFNNCQETSRERKNSEFDYIMFIQLTMRQYTILLTKRSFFVVCLMAFNATFNIISVISRRSVLLVEET